ncbi:Fad-binding protein [Thalictrum thalictroides]|uniref:Fad-binding protein n=1 Tax=Thalictrum thalictroides TaxID=46969 RepID=A0A7J6V3E2_THATH|nr:Fad-binding protein [Thalictrum thalictroides]
MLTETERRRRLVVAIVVIMAVDAFFKHMGRYRRRNMTPRLPRAPYTYNRNPELRWQHTLSRFYEMASIENVVLPDLDKRVYCIFQDFMTKITKFDEMVSIASKLLVGFHQQLELLQSPPLNKTSQVVDNIVKANQTDRVKAYAQSGCRITSDGIQKVNTCQQGLRDHLSKAKGELNELQLLMDDLVCVLQTANTSTSQCQDERFSDAVLHPKEEIEYTPPIKPEVSDYAVMMAIMYNMLIQEYSMQEKIVSSLRLNSSSGELESYCLMWSVRPFVNDDIMHQAWRFIS